jgi:glutathione synthase
MTAVNKHFKPIFDTSGNKVSNSAAHRICFIMDPYPTLNLDTETSLLCMDELMKRGHQVFWLEQDKLSLRNDNLTGKSARLVSVSPFKLAPEETINLDDMSAIVIRKDPPFDKLYLHLTYMLDFLAPTVAQINSPRALRNINEKLFTLNWPHHCPDTLTTMDRDILHDFILEHRKVVLKPLDDCSGRGISFVTINDAGLDESLDELFTDNGKPRFVMAQEFLPQISSGDKRIYLVNGEAVGWVNRIPPPGSDLANIHQGATCHASELMDRERMLSWEIGSELKQEGIILAGLDFIGGYLTEINVTSPSAVRQINAVYNSKLEIVIVDGILEVIESSQSHNPLLQSLSG